MADGLQAPAASARLRPMHKPPLAFAGIIPAGEDTPAEPPPEGARLPSGSITISPWTVVSKCALRRGPTKRSERPGHPQTLRFGSLLLVDHRLSSLCHFATNEPSANVYLDGETTLYTIHLKRNCFKDTLVSTVSRICSFFVDDGWSGTNFRVPLFFIDYLQWPRQHN